MKGGLAFLAEFTNRNCSRNRASVGCIWRRMAFRILGWAYSCRCLSMWPWANHLTYRCLSYKSRVTLGLGCNFKTETPSWFFFFFHHLISSLQCGVLFSWHIWLTCPPGVLRGLVPPAGLTRCLHPARGGSPDAGTHLAPCAMCRCEGVSPSVYTTVPSLITKQLNRRS